MSKIDKEIETVSEIFLKNAPFTMSIFDKDLNIIMNSPHAVEMFGLSKSEQFIKQFYELSPEYQPCGTPSREKALYYVSKALDEGKSTFSWMHKTIDGTPLPTEVTLLRFIYKGVPQIISFAVDLRSAIAIQELEFEKKSKQMLQAILDTAPFGCCVTDENINALYCNDALVHLLDLKNKEECLALYFELSPEYQPCGTLSREKMDQFIKQIHKKGHTQFEWTHQTLDGTLIPVEVNCFSTTINGKTVNIGYIRDLRELNKYKEIEHSANERISFMLNTVPLIINYWGSNYNIKDTNQAALNFYGYASKEEAFKNAYKDILENTDWKDRLDEIFEKGSASFIYEDALSNLWEVEGIRTVHNNETIAITYSKNITHFKKLQEEHRQREIAEESNKAKTMFIANISHEIRTPINSILGYSELALDDVIPTHTREYLNRILINSKLLLNIINNVLDISKIDSGLFDLEETVFDINEVIKHCQYLILPFAEEKRVKLSFHVETSELQGKYLIGDPTKINQICTNILSNAVKFTDSNGVVTVNVIAKALDENSCTLNFEFKDTGIGMTKDQISRSLDPFMQADSSTTRKYGGTGLGLAITQRFLNIMGSDLIVQSSLGIGSKFSFTLTLKTVKAEMAISEKAIKEKLILAKPIFKEGEVLVVDDNKMNMGVICEHLKQVGLTPTIALNGKEAIDKVKQRIDSGEPPYGLILMDLYMPIMDGKEASSIITDLNTGTPIVAMTAGIIIKEEEGPFASSVANHYLSKPFTRQEIWHILLEYFQPINNTKDYKHDFPRHSYIVEDKELLEELKLLFAKTNQDTVENITRFLEQGNIKYAHMLVHNLKSSALLIDKVRLSNISKEVERCLNKAEMPSSELIGELRSELRLVLDELAHLLN